jgi:transposase
VVDQLNIDAIIKQYRGGGTTSYHPRVMIKILFYAYTNNIYSCRKIEKALQENIHFMWLSGLCMERSRRKKQGKVRNKN